MLNRTQTWLAAGVLAVASIPAVSFATSHKPTQAAPSMSATSIAPASTAKLASTSIKPRHHAAKPSHKKLSSKRKAHTNLKHTGAHAKKLSHTSKRHTKLNASSKKKIAA